MTEGLRGGALQALHFPVPGQQLGDAPGRVILQTCGQVGELGLRIDVVELCRLDQGIDGGGAPAAGVGTGEGPVVVTDGDAAHCSLSGVVAETQAAIAEEADQHVPDVEAVGDRLGDLAVRRQPVMLLAQPDAERLDRSRLRS